MIVKSFNLKDIDTKSNIILFYGNNEGQKEEEINKLYKKNEKLKKIKYEEKDILSDLENFYSTVFNHSFFENEKFIIIKNVTDKILNLINELISKDLGSLRLILDANVLDKKSKLRNFFEKDKFYACVPFYPDNEISLSKIAYEHLKENNIALSREIINHIIKKSNGDRTHLLKEIEKISIFSKNKKITNEEVIKLINLNQEHEFNDLVNSCLCRNKINVKTILNDNTITHEDIIIIIRTFISKIKKLIKLIELYIKKGDLEEAINMFKPPIFWKEKEIVKKQILTWTKSEIKELLYKINSLELIVKQKSDVSKFMLINFIYEKTIKKSNNI